MWVLSGCYLGVWGAVFVCVCVCVRVFGCPYRYGGIARYGRVRGYLPELVCRHGVCAVLEWGWVGHCRA